MVYTGLFQLDPPAWRHRKQGGSITTGNGDVIFQGSRQKPAADNVKTSNKTGNKRRPHEYRNGFRASSMKSVKRVGERESCKRAEVGDDAKSSLLWAENQGLGQGARASASFRGPTGLSYFQRPFGCQTEQCRRARTARNMIHPMQCVKYSFPFV